MDLDTSNSDECYVTAKQIFHYCGAVNSGTLRVDSLMDKFAPFVKTNKAEYSFLRSLLDPDKTNPDINVTELAQALTKYSESQKRGDLDESFNFKCGQVPQDSDSGISNDGFQLLEDLQCELREKSHLASKLRSQLDFTDRQHEEALAAITAERDTLRAQLNMLRDENASLAAARRDCEDACEKLCGSERALDETRRELDRLRRRAKAQAELAQTLEGDKPFRELEGLWGSEKALDETRRELDSLRRRAKAQAELAQTLEGDKLTLQELLNKSKEECHRINEMYASRQSNLLEQNEALRSQSAELSARASDQDEFLQQLLREKVVLEMELKDMLNKSSHAASRLDRSVDVSYTEDQMLTALDSLTADSRFVPENHLLDEESFMNALKDDPGRCTNLSIFDELRLSFGNMSRLHPNHDRTHEESADMATQTDEITLCADNNNVEIPCGDCQLTCLGCKKLKDYSAKLESDVKRLESNKRDMLLELTKYEENLQLLQNSITEGDYSNGRLQNVVETLETKLLVLEAACESQKAKIESLVVCDTICAECQTQSDVASISTQVDVPCVECVKRSAPAPQNKSWRRFMWEHLKSLFSVLAGVCCVAALIVLYNVSNYHYASRRCIREAPAVPWRWLNVHDLLDFVFRIEYVGEVPM